MLTTKTALPLSLLFVFAACSSSSGSTEPTSSGSLAIVTVSGAPLTAVAGDGLALKVVEKMSDGSTQDLASGAQVSWSGPPTVTATAPDATPAATAYPATGATPTAFWISNPPRTDHASDLTGVLFVLDPGTTAGGTVAVTATVTGASAGTAMASVAISAGPTGDAMNGAALYGTSGANCAECHGASGHGSADSTDNGATFVIDGQPYSFPAPGLNAEMGNTGDPTAGWTAALFTISSRADLDDGAVSLRLPMPNWVTTKSPGSNKLLTTQDFADIYAFMATQTH